MFNILKLKEIPLPSNQRCIICGGKYFKLVTNLRKGYFKKKASIYKCAGCEFAITVPKPEANYEYYKYTSQELKNDIKKGKTLNYIYKQMVDMFDNLFQDKNEIKILDFGSGRGDLIRNFKIKYPNAELYAIEPSKINQKFLSEYNVKVFNSISDLIENNNYQFDVITVSSVLEHIEDFQAVLGKLLSLKKKEGFLFISQAVYTGLLPTLLPFAWYGWQPHEHFYHFSKNSIEKIVRNRELIIVSYAKKSLYQPLVRGKNFILIMAQLLIFLVSKIGQFFGRGDLHNVIIK